jgi:hypothetical protein
MIKAVAASVVLLSVTAGVARPIQVPQGAWLQDGLKWSKAPKKINPRLSYAQAVLAYFGPNHAFSIIYATVNRVPAEYEVICNGCGQVVYSGSWELDEKAIRVKFRLVYRTVELRGEQLPGPVNEDTVKFVGDALVLLGHSFHRASALDTSVLESIPRGAVH